MIHIMKCLIIPGADSFECHEDRLHLAQFDLALFFVKKAEKILFEHGINLELESFLTEPNQNTNEWFIKLAIVTVPLHKAIYEIYKQTQGHPDIILSCSLGDISRNAIFEICSFEDSVLGMHLFAQNVVKIKSGESYIVKSNVEFQSNKFESLKKYSVHLGIEQTKKQLMLCGKLENINDWATSELQSNYRIFPLYPFPLHCILMKSCSDQLKIFLNSKNINSSPIKVFSALSLKFIDEKQSFRDEINTNIIDAVLWSKAIKKLSVMYPQIEFVNLGASTAMLKFAEKSAETEHVFLDFFSYSVKMGYFLKKAKNAVNF